MDIYFSVSKDMMNLFIQTKRDIKNATSKKEKKKIKFDFKVKLANLITEFFSNIAEYVVILNKLTQKYNRLSNKYKLLIENNQDSETTDLNNHLKDIKQKLESLKLLKISAL